MTVRRLLPCDDTTSQLLRRLRYEPYLVALTGRWTLGADEGAEGGAAVIGFDPIRVLEPDADPFQAVTEHSVGSDGVGDEEVFGGGWIGAWGYQLGRRIERLPATPPRQRPQPDHHLCYYDFVLRRRSATDEWWYESIAAPDRVDHTYAAVLRSLAGPAPAARPYACSPFTMTPAPRGHERAVARALEHVVAGDIFQANVCLRLDATYDGDPLDLFCAGVETLQPAHAAFLRMGDGRAVASFSPELFLRRRGRAVLTSPIKGTAPLTDDVIMLSASAKNRAENVMIVDLMRNDLGRVCAPGSIEASADPRLQQHTGVWHLVSDVTGTLRAGASDADLLRSTFPPGSVTGAPKVAAMAVVNEVETTARELYTGAIGYVSPHAGLETSVVIRTFEFAPTDDGTTAVWLGVGGGVVVGSTPEGELSECLVKARPLLRAVGAELDACIGPGVRREPVPQAPAVRSFPTATGPLPDPALGVFDTLLVQDGVAVDLRAHIRRLADSLRTLYGTDLDVAALAARVRDAAAALSGPHRLRLTSADGRAVEIGTTPLGERPTVSWRLRPRTVPGGLGAHKWDDRRLLAGLGGPGERETDPMLVDEDGTVLETGRGCLFIVTDDGVHTPAADGRILPGIARQRVLDLVRTARVPVFERRVHVDELGPAVEVFVTNAIGGIRPVTAVEGVGAWPFGPTTRWLRERLELAWAGEAAPPVAPARRRPDARVLLIDNYDSFVYNLAQYVAELGARAVVVRNDEVSVDEVADRHAAGDFTHVIVSPGPGTPSGAGISNAVIERLAPFAPILGVCLGHQCIGEVFGGRVVGAAEVVHGRPALVHHDGRGVYAGLDGPLVSARYHSLVVTDVPDVLLPTAHTGSGVLMGLRHRTLPVEGVQMHPESVLTPYGHQLVSNFLAPPAGRADV